MRTRIGIAVVVAAAVLAAVASGCAKRSSVSAAPSTAAATRQDLRVTVEATGVVEPVELVEVKSKASGLIVKMPVDVGSVVTRGQLLAQVDPHDVQASDDQAAAALEAAQAKESVARAQLNRAEQLYATKLISDVDHEAAVLTAATARADLVTARTNRDLAKQKLEDATVTASVAGTVLVKSVSAGQVISSATASVSGGTTLLQMADLSRVRVRTYVTENDIGKVRRGAPTTVVVEAYPQRTFAGSVEKIEPQAVVQQSVTMFPVLVSVDNAEGLLLPGMNGEVTIEVARRAGVVTVPLDAVRTASEMQSVRGTLGLAADSALAAAGPAASTTAKDDGPPPPDGGGGAPAGGNSTASASLARAVSRVQQGGAAASVHDAAATTRYVVASRDGVLALRRVTIGLANYDDVEIMSGLDAGESVVLLGAVELQQQRTQQVAQIRQRTSSMNGFSSGSTSGARTSAAAGK